MTKARFLVAFMIALCTIALIMAQDNSKDDLLQQLQNANIDEDDLALIMAHASQLDADRLEAINSFLPDSQTIAESHWFDITAYNSWDAYNFGRPTSDVVTTNLARRDLFLDPARQLNNRAITNMSDEALASLVFAQTYVEEKWDHRVPWEDPNSIFNWIQPEVLETPWFIKYISGDDLYQEQVRYWFAVNYPELLEVVGDGDDMAAALTYMQPPIQNVPRLAGYSFPIGNQLYTQTAETLLWYGDYMNLAEARYGQFNASPLDTQIDFPEDSSVVLDQTPPNDWEFTDIDGLWGLFNAPFAEELRQELSHPETASFWNVMRFLHAAARQREGGNQPLVMALRYDERSDSPVGRSIEDVSAFSILTTVYSDSILLDFTNWNNTNESLIVAPVDANRSDGLHRLVSERNKAIDVIEHLGNEAFYPDATHVAGSRGLGFDLTTQYNDADGDFLPYTPEEAYFIVMALATEASSGHGIAASREVLCDAPLLKMGYDAYAESQPVLDWEGRIGNLCD